MGWIDTIWNLFGAFFKGNISAKANGFQETIKDWQETFASLLNMAKENGGVDPDVARYAEMVQSGLASASGAIPALTASAKKAADEAAAAAKVVTAELANRNAGGTPIALADPAASANPTTGQRTQSPAEGRGPTA